MTSLALLRGLAACVLLVAATVVSADPIPAGPLPRDVVPLHYRLDLSIDPGREDYTGEVAIQIEIRRPGARIWLHGRGLDVADALLERDGAGSMPLRVEPESLRHGGVFALSADQPLTPGSATLKLRFRARFDRQLQGTYVVERDGDRYVMTQMQPLGARQSFPSFDEPAFKTPWSLVIRAPRGLAVLANTALVSSEDAGDGWLRHEFATSEPLPTYLVAYAVGPWDVVEHAALPATAVRDRAIPLRGFAARGRGHELAYALAQTRLVLEALETWFDQPYPYSKLDILAAPDFAAGAMENAGLILYRESLLFVTADSPPDPLRAFYQVHAHELAHQWFGNLVTMPWWDDLWLNEAFATWMAAKITEQLRPDLAAGRSYRARILGAMAADSLDSVRRVAEPVEDWREIEAAFDGITYAKGGGVLQMFESWLGEEAFRAAVRDYIRLHAGGSARGGDLLAALARQSADAEALRAAFLSFIRQPGVPEIEVALQCHGMSAQIDVSQRRYLPTGSAADPDRVWSLPLCLRMGDAAGHATVFCSLLDPLPQQQIELPEGRGCPIWLMPNAGAAGYYRFRLDPASLDALAGHLDALDEAELQAYADALDAALHAGALPLDAWLRASAPLATSSEPEVVLAAADTLRWLGRHLFGAGAAAHLYRGLMQTRFGPPLARIGFAPAADDTVSTRRLRRGLIELVAMEARDPQLRDMLTERARQALADDDMQGFAGLGADLRAIALAVLVEDGQPDEFHRLLERFRAAQDPRLRIDLLRALARAPLAEQRLQALELALSPAVHGGELLALLGPLFDDPAHMSQAWAWFERHEDALFDRLPGFARSHVPGLYGRAACDLADAERIRQRFAERMGNTDAGPRALAQAVERIRLCAALRESLAGAPPDR